MLDDAPPFPTPLRTETVPCTNGRYNPNIPNPHNEEFRPYCSVTGECIECKQTVPFEAFAEPSTSVYWNRTFPHDRPLHYFIIKDPVWGNDYYGGWHGDLINPSDLQA